MIAIALTASHAGEINPYRRPNGSPSLLLRSLPVLLPQLVCLLLLLAFFVLMSSLIALCPLVPRVLLLTRILPLETTAHPRLTAMRLAQSPTLQPRPTLLLRQLALRL